MSAVPLGARRPSEAGEPVSLEAALIIAAALGDIGAVSRSLARGLAADAAPPGKPSALARHGADLSAVNACGDSALARCRDARTRAALLSAMAASPPAHVLGDRSVRH